MDEVIRNVEWLLLDAAIVLRDAWKVVKPATISTCFKKAGFAKPVIDTNNLPNIELSDLEIEEDEDVSLFYDFVHRATRWTMEDMSQTVPTCDMPHSHTGRGSHQYRVNINCRPWWRGRKWQWRGLSHRSIATYTKEVLCALETVRRFEFHSDLGENHTAKVNSRIGMVKNRWKTCDRLP